MEKDSEMKGLSGRKQVGIWEWWDRRVGSGMITFVGTVQRKGSLEVF